MKRVTFRVPEDHDVVITARVLSMSVYANAAGYQASADVVKEDDEYGHWAYGWFPTSDEAQAAAEKHARNLLLQSILLAKVGTIR